MPDVASLLARSREAHNAFHARHKFLGQGKREAGSDEVGKASILQAKALREEAHQADPEHRDVAWAADRVPHAEIMSFYSTYLSTH